MKEDARWSTCLNSMYLQSMYGSTQISSYSIRKQQTKQKYFGRKEYLGKEKHVKISGVSPKHDSYPTISPHPFESSTALKSTNLSLVAVTK